MTMAGWYFYLVGKHMTRSLVRDIVASQTAEETDSVQFSKIKNKLILEVIEVMQHVHDHQH